MADATSDSSAPATGAEDEDAQAQQLLAEAAGQDDETEGQDGDGESEGAEQLGDAGKRALDATKQKWKSERQKRREAEAELEQLRKGAGDGEDAAEKARREAEQAATAKANQRIVRSEVRAAAAKKLTDPKDALRFLDLEHFEVDEDGEIDAEEVGEAIDDLLQKKPYLAAQGGKRFQGSGDGGASGRSPAKPKQLTREDVKRMSNQEIVKAKAEGRLNELLGT